MQRSGSIVRFSVSRGEAGHEDHSRQQQIMRPLRRKQQYEVTDGPVPGQERVLESNDEAHLLSDEGSVDSSARHKCYPNDCGCFKPVGGRCVQCGQLSCVDCHGHCNSCGKPLCRECTVSIDLPNAERIRLCGRCHTQIRRQQRTARIMRVLLSPLVKFED